MTIPPLRHHIVFVSKQTLPTIIGVSLPGSEPTCIHAVVTPAMQDIAKTLNKTLSDTSRNLTFAEYQLVHGDNQEEIYQVLDTIKESCNSTSLAINLTGGTKLMALATWEWAQANQILTFYIDTNKGSVIQIGQKWQYYQLPDVLTIFDILAANGFSVENFENDSVPTNRQQILTKLLTLVTTSKEGAEALGCLNSLAHKAKELNLRVQNPGSPSAAWGGLLNLCIEAGQVQVDNCYLSFTDEKARRWCNGIWFEEYVKMTLFRLKEDHHIKDFSTSVQVNYGGVSNELDAIFSCRNRLFTIECKTNEMLDTETYKPQKGAEALYKADSLRDKLGGTYSGAMLCSVRKLKISDLQRAKNFGVEIVCGKDLLNLAEKLISWSNL